MKIEKILYNRNGQQVTYSEETRKPYFSDMIKQSFLNKINFYLENKRDIAIPSIFSFKAKKDFYNNTVKKLIFMEVKS